MNPALSRQPELWRGLIFIVPFWEYGGWPIAWTSTGARDFTRDGTNGIPEWVPASVVGTVRKYTKSNVTLEIMDDSKLPATFPAKGNNPFTLLLYMRAQGLPSNFENIITKMSTLNGPNPEDRSFMLFLNSNGTVQSRAGINTADQALSTSTVDPFLNELIGVRFDGSTGSVIVRDNIEDSADWSSGILTNTDPLCFGGQRNTFEQTDRSFNGAMHIAYVWDRALTEAEIRRVYNDPFGIVTQTETIVSTVTGVSASDGSVAGDSVTHNITIAANVSDGSIISDTANTVLTFVVSGSDGLLVGDEGVGVLNIPVSAISGSSVGASGALTITISASLVDGAVAGESSTVFIEAGPPGFSTLTIRYT